MSPRPQIIPASPVAFLDADGRGALVCYTGFYVTPKTALPEREVPAMFVFTEFYQDGALDYHPIHYFILN